MKKIINFKLKPKPKQETSNDDFYYRWDKGGPVPQLTLEEALTNIGAIILVLVALGVIDAIIGMFV